LYIFETLTCAFNFVDNAPAHPHCTFHKLAFIISALDLELLDFFELGSKHLVFLFGFKSLLLHLGYELKCVVNELKTCWEVSGWLGGLLYFKLCFHVSDSLFLLDHVVGRSESKLAFQLIHLFTACILDSRHLLSHTFFPNLVKIGKHHVNEIIS
jgi:hypothetical protein